MNKNNEMKTRKVIIPAAGLGTRLFPATKIQPKEMLPVFSLKTGSCLSVKPMVHIIFEQLYDAGLNEFCFVVGRGKRAIEDHFMPDNNCVRYLENRGNKGQAADLDTFYDKLRNSTITYVNQPEPKGFGNAVLQAQPFVQDDYCLVHAGDGYIISEKMDYINKLIDASERLKAEATFLAMEVNNPKHHGIIEGIEVEKGLFQVKRIVEKPEQPKSNLTVVAVYVFHPIIFRALKETKPDKNEELQLTDAIQKLIDWGLRVYALKLDKNYSRLNIESPESYWKVLELSHKHKLR